MTEVDETIARVKQDQDAFMQIEEMSKLCYLIWVKTQTEAKEVFGGITKELCVISYCCLATSLLRTSVVTAYKP